MKKLILKNAITLLELLIATALVSVVLLGIFSISNVLDSNNQDYGVRYYLKADTQTTLNHILKNASLAIGSGTMITLSDGVTTVADKGILIGPENGQPPGDYGQMCIHQNPTNTLGGDVWMCYFLDDSNSPQNPRTQEIVYYYKKYTLNDVYRGSHGPLTKQAVFLGGAYSWRWRDGQASPPRFVIDGSEPMSFNITIQNCLNNKVATCSPNGVSNDPVNNPEIQLSGTVVPSQHGMQNN